MAVFIEVESDPFLQRFEEESRVAATGYSGVTGEDILAVRRPLRGIQERESTYSYIRIIDRFGRSFPMINSSFREASGETFSNYLLGQIQFTRAERYSIVNTFGDAYVFMFGENPIQASITGSLVNSMDFTWPAEFWMLYEQYLRGTKLAEMGARMYLYVDNVLIEGVCLSFSDSMVADQPNLVPFNLSILVTNIAYVGGNPDMNNLFPVRRQQVEALRHPDALGVIQARSPQEEAEARHGTAGVQALESNRAAWDQNRSRADNERRLALYEQAVSEGASTVSALRFAGLVPPDAIAALNRLRPRVLLGPPLRSTIWDNVDEYLIHPSQRPPPAAEEEVPEAEAAEPIHEADPVDHEELYPEYHYWDEEKQMWVYDPPPGGPPHPIDDPFDVPDRLAPPTTRESESLGEMVGSTPDGEPSFGSGVIETPTGL